MIALSADEVAFRFGRLGIPNRFEDMEKQSFDTTTSVETGARVLAFPTPKDNVGLNLLNLRHILGASPAKQPSFFDHPWYLDEPFAKQDCGPGWHALTMDVLPGSIGQPINYASSVDVPSAIEVVLMLFLHYIGTGEQLLLKKHTWTKDEATLGRFVTIGAFGRNGLFVSGHPGEYSSRGLGICAKVSRS